jgi:hypothetical protein
MRTLDRLHSPVFPLVLGALVLAGALALAQDPPPPARGGGGDGGEQEEEVPKWPLASDARNEALRKELLGAWQVVQTEHRGSTLPGGSGTGFALFVDGYLSIEVHMRLVSALPGGTGLFFQTGTHRWRLTPGGQMETSSLIGTHNFTPDEQVRFQPPGEARVWNVLLDGPQLTLERPGESRLVLRKLGFLPFPGEDPEFGFKRPREERREEERRRR